MYVVLFSNLHFFPFIPRLSLQPGCDPMTAPVLVPMLLHSNQVRWICPSSSHLSRDTLQNGKGTESQKINAFTGPLFCHQTLFIQRVQLLLKD